MGLLDTLLGRTKPVQSNLDDLFGIPSAAITLQSASGQVFSGHAGVCFKPPSGQGFEEMQAEVVKLLAMDETGAFRKSEDTYGYQWLAIEDPDINQLVTEIHLVNSSLADAGWGPQLLCSVFGIASAAGALDSGGTADEGTGAAAAASPAATAGDASSPAATFPAATAADAGSVVGPGRVLASSAYLVYLFKRGTFYPFIPDGHEHRDLEQELKLKSLIADDLSVEGDLDRWFPLWELPVG